MSDHRVSTPYEDLLQDIVDNGVYREDRTGTGTLSVFGRQMRWDLSQGFPLITTKKVAWKAVKGELLWFLRGDTNIRWLKNNNISIWDEWAREDGSLGPVYGSQWRSWPDEQRPVVEVKVREAEQVDHADVIVWGDEHNEEGRLLDLWRSVHKRASGDTADLSADKWTFGGSKVSPAWCSYEDFVDTITSVPGYAQWNMSDDYVLTPRYYGSDVYSPETCIFMKADHLVDIPHRKEEAEAVEIDGSLYLSMNDYYNRNNVLNVDTPVEVKKVVAREGYVWRRRQFVDQIEEVIEGLKSNPFSRRLIVNSWNVSLLDDMALPPCHMTFQFYVANNKLSCHLYQRSADMFLGVPFNIASYSLLVYIVAQQIGLEVGDFVWTGGDCHIYTNHLEQVKEQLSREPRPYPELVLKKRDSVDDYQIEDAQVVGYDPHPAIKGEVSV